MRLPYGADEIMRARENGMAPADPIIVSCVGKLDEANPVVIPNDARHDWRFLAGLEVFVFVGRGARFVKETLQGIAPYAREDIALWDRDQQRGMNTLAVWDYDSKTWKRKRLTGWAYLTWSEHENRRFAQCD